MYQSLRPLLPPAPEGVDDRSIHFMLLPEPDAAYANADMERAVRRMQAVIEMGRYVRETKAISLKVGTATAGG